MNKESAIVIKFGGSASTNLEGINPEYFDLFFQQINLSLLETVGRAAFIVGGGPRVRELQKYVTTPEEKDQVGIEATQEHARQLGELLQNHGVDVIPEVPTSPQKARELIHDHDQFAVVLGGLQIGQSTDTVAIEVADIFREEGFDPFIVILSNVLGIYTADPKSDPDAKLIAEANIQTLIEDGILARGKAFWRPGMPGALDPVATEQLSELEEPYPILFAHAQNTQDVENFINGEPITEGTLVHGTEELFLLR